MRVLGIDPGVHGGLAIVDIDIDSTVLVDAIDIPTTGIKAKQRVDVLAVRDWILAHQPRHALIEHAGVMPRQGIASGFRYGRAVGALEAAIALCNIPLTIVEPAVWKRRLGLYGSDKENSRQRALQLFPTAHALLARRMDHGRAEAALIAIVPMQMLAKVQRP